VFYDFGKPDKRNKELSMLDLFEYRRMNEIEDELLE